MLKHKYFLEKSGAYNSKYRLKPLLSKHMGILLEEQSQRSTLNFTSSTELKSSFPLHLKVVKLILNYQKRRTKL